MAESGAIKDGKPPASTTAAAPASAPSGRLSSLDALRGFDMFWIVGGTSIAAALGKMQDNAFTRFLTTQLTHATWEGFRFYDLVFPLFLFIVGVSMVFSLDRQLASGGRVATILKVARRSALLFAIGVFAAGGLSKPWTCAAGGPGADRSPGSDAIRSRFTSSTRSSAFNRWPHGSWEATRGTCRTPASSPASARSRA